MNVKEQNQNRPFLIWSCFVCSPLPAFSLAACALKASMSPLSRSLSQYLWPNTDQPLATFLMVDGWEGSYWVLGCLGMGERHGSSHKLHEKEGHICSFVCSFQRINSISDGTQKSRDNVQKSKHFMVSAKPVSSSLSWKLWTRQGHMHHRTEVGPRWTCHLAL